MGSLQYRHSPLIQINTYYHYDGTGNVTALTGDFGRIQQEYTYDAYGNLLSQNKHTMAHRKHSSTEIENAYLFSTKEYSPQSGLIYFGARYYDPRVGRWITKDPLGMIDGLNLYVFVANNPVNWIDPLGLRKKEFELIIGPGGEIGYVIIGGGVLHVTITDIQTGESTLYTVPVLGIGLGLPQITITSRPVTFTMNDPNVTSASFEGYGYIGGASAVAGGGVTIGGGIKVPQGPFIPGRNIDLNYGGVRIGVSHSIVYFYKR